MVPMNASSAACAAVAIVLAASGVGTVAGAQSLPSRAPLPQSRPQAASPPAVAPQAPPLPSPRSTTRSPAVAASACQARLAVTGVRFASVAATDPRVDCAIEDPVQLDSMATDGGEVRWPDRPIVSCSFAGMLADFTRDVAEPLARATTGRAIAAFGTGPGFACRPRNRVEGGQMSAHGRGLAIDIAWFEFAGGHRETVEAPGDEKVARLIHALRRSACGWFTTVLGPGSDAAHVDHLHLDAERRGQRGDSRLCQ